MYAKLSCTNILIARPEISILPGSCFFDFFSLVMANIGINKIKVNAEKLLYGLEAMRFMRDEAKIKEFSRRKVADTFIDATGFKDMSSKFDDVYNTAYLDLEKGQYYRILTEVRFDGRVIIAG